MLIESYQFGKIVIDGKTYTSDVIIANNVVRANWWRKQGHLLSVEDIETIAESRPEVLIIGCGASGMIKVAGAVKDFLSENGIQFEVYDTSSGVERFNELSLAGVKVSAVLHLAC